MAKRYWMCIFALSLTTTVVFVLTNPRQPGSRQISPILSERSARGLHGLVGSSRRASGRVLSLPVAFEPARPTGRKAPQFVARETNVALAVTSSGIQLVAARGANQPQAMASLQFLTRGHASHGKPHLRWYGVDRLRGETNYLVGNNPMRWRTHVPRYTRVETSDGQVGIAVYARGRQLEYDLRVPPGINASNIRLAVSGAQEVGIDKRGNLMMRVATTEFRMDKPVVYEETGLSASADLGNARPAKPEFVSYKSRLRTRSTRPGAHSHVRGYSHRSRSGRRSGRIRTHTYRPRSSRGRSRTSRGYHRRLSRRRRRRLTRRRRKPTANIRNFPVGHSALPIENAAIARSSNTIARHPLNASYVVEADGTIGFRIAQHDPHATVVIDPTISLAYSSFLGGAGTDVANSVATDPSGNIYIAGMTTSPTTFPETTPAQLGPGLAANPTSGSTPHEFFIAKIDPTQAGANSLVYLTFLGGSTDQEGGLIAVDSAGDVAITGVTSSADFPVTDGSTRTSGSNDTVVSEIDPTGSNLLYSTFFGGSGAESQQNTGGIALDTTGDIFVASDTNSTDLPVTAGSYAGASSYVGPSASDEDFLAIFQPRATPELKYCTYLGVDGQTGVSGIAVDASGSAYVAGFTDDKNADFPFTNAAQPFFGGGAFDAFLMKIAPAGNGPADLVYATLLGGSSSDKAFAVALDSANPPNAYLTGTTSSTNFPTNGAVAAYQNALPSNATSATSDAFVSVIAQNATTGQTSLAYSTYLGGSQTDAGYGIEAAQPYAVYLTGTANSWDFPWHDNFQPFNGYGNAFVAKLDTTTPGTLGLVYSTPLGGTSPPGERAGTQGSALAVVAAGTAGCEPSDGISDCIWIAGQTTSADFASAGSPGNGFQQICGSCQESPAPSDAFLAEVQTNINGQSPSLYFAGPMIPLNFGNQLVGASNVPQQFAAIKNGGESPLNISSIEITGANQQDFSLSNFTTCESGPISPGGMCSFEVGFVPSIAGPEQAFVQVTTNAPGSPQTLEVLGTGGGLNVVPESLTFGPQVAGTDSTAQMVTLANTSTDTLEIDQTPIEGDSEDFNLTNQAGPQGCHSTISLTPQSNCLISVEFTPASAGAFTAEIAVQYHDLDNSAIPEQQQTVSLSGTAVPAAPVAALYPSSLNFGALTTGQTSVTQTITLTNTGSAALALAGINLAGINPTDFAIVSAGNPACPASGSIAINAACTVGVQFVPQTAGAKSATLSFTDSAAGSPQTVALAGTAQAPAAIQITPSSLTFARQAVETKSAPQQITIANTGGTALAINGISLTGTNAGDFSQTNNCSPSLAANASCLASVLFEPSAQGTRTASLTVADNGSGSPQQVALTGTGTQPDAEISSASINFGNQAVGTASATATVTVTNPGNGPLVISGISLVGANASDFTETDNCTATAAPDGIAAGGTCTIQVVFRPACGPVATANRTATLNLTDNAPGSPQSIALSGTGTGSFCFIVPSGGSTTASISPGQTETYALQVEAANAFTGNVNVACSGAPANATCSVSPAMLNIGGSEIAALQVSVATSAGAATDATRTPGQAPKPLSRVLPVIEPAVLALMVVLALLLFALARTERSHESSFAFGAAEIGFPSIRRPRSRRAIAFMSLTFAMAVLVASCGGGTSSVPPSAPADPPTPAGTYTITVTGTTSTGASQSIALTLTVE